MPDRPAHQFSYNASDLPESYTPPAVPGAGSPTLYSYNLDRQLTRTTRPDGGTLDFTYDQGGRLSVLSFPGGQLTYTYSTTTGNVSSIAALGGPTLSYTYDGSLARSVSWTGGAVSGRLSFAYDNDFRVASDSVNGGHAVDYGYDQDGLLVTVGSLSLTRDAQNGRLTGTSLDAVISTAAYDSLGLASGTVVSAAGAEVFRTSYRRDALGRLTELAETVAGEAVAWNYGYDTAGRLSEVTRNGSAYATYEYDANGNRNRVVTAAGAVSASYDAQDRLVSQGTVAYSYTANGELWVKSVGTSVTQTQYDALGGLRSAALPGGTVIEYVIDPVGRRVARRVNGSLDRGFLYAGPLSPTAELGSDGNVVTRFVYATRSNVPDYMVKGGITYRLVTDHLGSVRLVVNASTGAVVQRLEYDPWGRVELNTNPGFQPFGFAGGLYDHATGLTRFGARDYDAEAGRWTAKDPIGFSAGDNNLYGYVFQDPVNNRDSFGLCKDANGNQRPCLVYWSKSDKHNPDVSPRIMSAAQRLADIADVDLQLSSGFRPGDRGNHGRHLAVDINEINGIDIGYQTFANAAARCLVGHVQAVVRSMQEIRENFGPAGLWKASTPGGSQVNYNNGSAKRRGLQRAHMNHIHISVQPR